MANLYTVKRDDICVGKVITDFDLNTDATNLYGQKMRLGTFYAYRSMLFVQNYEGKAEDLLYFSPQYRILNDQNIEACKNEKIIIDQAHNISKLLKFFGYGDELTYLEVEGIRKRFFNGKFPIENAEKFGLQEVAPENQKYYDNKGVLVVDPYLLKILIKQRKKQQLFGYHREFTGLENPDIDELTIEQLNKVILPSEYFDILRDHGDHALYEVLHGYEERMDAFKPHKEEGIVRSLKKYN